MLEILVATTSFCLHGTKAAVSIYIKWAGDVLMDTKIWISDNFLVQEILFSPFNHSILKIYFLTCSLCKIRQCARLTHGHCLLTTIFLFISFWVLELRQNIVVWISYFFFFGIDQGHLLALGFGCTALEDLRPLYSCFWHLSENDCNAEISWDCDCSCWTGFQRCLRLPIHILTKSKIFFMCKMSLVLRGESDPYQF